MVTGEVQESEMWKNSGAQWRFFSTNQTTWYRNYRNSNKKGLISDDIIKIAVRNMSMLNKNAADGLKGLIFML